LIYFRVAEEACRNPYPVPTNRSGLFVKGIKREILSCIYRVFEISNTVVFEILCFKVVRKIVENSHLSNERFFKNSPHKKILNRFENHIVFSIVKCR
jgi:hypothetical protein